MFLIIIFYYSIAKCLGARRVCKRAYEWLDQHNIISEAVPDEEVIKACVKFSGILAIIIHVSVIVRHYICGFNISTKI